MAEADGQDDALGAAAQGHSEGSALAKTGMGNGDSSPRCTAVLDAPLANPVFMSDAPNFLQRQRNRAAKALVSEHAGTITCRCQKCAEAARARAGPAVSPDWPLPPVSKSTSSTVDVWPTLAPQARLQPSSLPGKRPQIRVRGVEAGNADQRPLSPDGGVQTVKRDYTWLLRVISEIVPSEGGGIPGTVSYDGTWVPDPASLQGKLGIMLPDTVILEKGKPKRRYHIDPAGRIQVTRMKTSAELLRVLRDFVRKAIKPREPGSRQESKDGKALAGSRSEGSLQAVPGMSSTGMASTLDSRTSSAGPPSVPIPQIEVAVLCYDDGLSRLMMLAEAVSQIRGASKLPREFWQHIHVLQVPIQSRKAGVPTRYITYSFDINNGGLDPQEPMPLGGGARLRLRSASRTASGRNWALAQKSAESEAARLAAVPKRLNDHLRSKSRRVGMEIVQGQFEFVLDEADGTLWLANASNLRCRFLPKSSSEDKNGANSEEEVVRFFEEEEFEEELRDTEKKMEQLRKRFGGDPGVAHGGTGVSGITVSASDQLAGVRVPNNLVRFYQEEEKMLRYYEDEVRVLALRPLKPLAEGRAVGLGCWFRRWVKSVKAPRPGRLAILE